MAQPEKPTKGFLILEAPSLQNFDNVVVSVVRDALVEFLLNYAEPEEAVDDRWYYGALKECLYDDDGEVKVANFLSEGAWRSFLRDEIGQFNDYLQVIKVQFETIIDLNHYNIETLYESYNLKTIDAIIYRNTIVLDIRGKKI